MCGQTLFPECPSVYGTSIIIILHAAAVCSIVVPATFLQIATLVVISSTVEVLVCTKIFLSGCLASESYRSVACTIIMGLFGVVGSKLGSQSNAYILSAI